VYLRAVLRDNVLLLACSLDNTLRRRLHIIGLSNNLICRKCGTEEETSVHVLCECVALASLRYTYLVFFFLVPDMRVLTMGAIWNFAKGTGLL
jgi:hypothetical protein